MQTVFPMDEDFPQGKQLYVSVIVTEKGSGEKDTIVDTSTFIAHPYYQVDFSSTDQYFKPGFNYTLRVRGACPPKTTELLMVLWKLFFKYDQKCKNVIENF